MKMIGEAPGANHLLGEILEVARESSILRRLGYKEKERYRVIGKAGPVIYLALLSGLKIKKGVGWIADPAALECLRPVFDPPQRFIPEGCPLFASRTPHLRILQGGGGNGLRDRGIPLPALVSSGS